eukprot:GILK01006578.1.p1 GENE.GILK01006578.1~~GILK01006578.1.p1  ORF type:complete len:403 (+),score=38.04 GILK01006578.1:32-1240(+)
MVTVLCAFDKFKGTLDSRTCGQTTLEALQDTCCPYDVPIDGSVVELSDGGDGFLSALTRALQLTIVTETVTGPLGSKIEAAYGIGEVDGVCVAVIEMALASGLALVPLKLRNPLHTTSKGTGELIHAAVRKGAQKLLLGVGGSATNDGGLGVLQGMGLQILVRGENGDVYEPDAITGQDLVRIASIRIPSPDQWEHCLFEGRLSIEIACDVSNLFVGLDGATAVYSGQKGATREIQQTLERGMLNLAQLYKAASGIDISNVPGTGAAGGISGGLVAMCKAHLIRGIEIVSTMLDLPSRIQSADLVLTGEGSFDDQTMQGKAVSHVIDLCNRYNVPVVVICGHNGLKGSSQTVPVFDLLSMFPPEVAMRNAQACLRQLVSAKAAELPGLSRLLLSSNHCTQSH